jgi:hypothetical protein
MYSIITGHYGLLAGQYTFTNTSLYFDTLCMGPPQWRSCLNHRIAMQNAFLQIGFKLESSNPLYVIIGGESRHICRYTVDLP